MLPKDLLVDLEKNDRTDEFYMKDDKDDKDDKYLSNLQRLLNPYANLPYGAAPQQYIRAFQQRAGVSWQNTYASNLIRQ